MQGYPGYGYKQESYVYVEEDNFMKDNSDYDNGSSMQTMRPNQHIPTPPHLGGYDQIYEGLKHGNERYRPNENEWKMDKPSHGDKMHDKGHKYEGLKHGNERYRPNDKEQQHHHKNWKMDKPSHGDKIHDEGYKNEGLKHGNERYRPNDKEQQHHHENWKVHKPSHGGKMHDEGYTYEYTEDMSHLMMGGGGNGGHHQAPPPMPAVVLDEPVKHYGDDWERRPYYLEHKKDNKKYWNFKGIRD
ncbi:Uncharacterized protein Fot_04593 [Forsythia ovata]|uniref:Uncharacterized protein n=1 Tax=Forsythia ovata TaxID=205694 RepID=A0ABD1XD09_9LAMI